MKGDTLLQHKMKVRFFRPLSPKKEHGKTTAGFWPENLHTRLLLRLNLHEWPNLEVVTGMVNRLFLPGKMSGNSFVAEILPSCGF